MRSSFASFCRHVAPALFLSTMTGALLAQEGTAPSNASPPAAAAAAQQTPAAPTLQSTQEAPSAATPAVPQHADMLYANDNGLMDAYTASSCATCGGDCQGSCGS